MGTNMAANSSPDAGITSARAMNALRSVVRAFRMNTRAIEQQMGLSLAQLFVLQQLNERPADSLNELADRTATHQSSVSVVVRRLVDRGLVTRSSSAADKRRVEIDLTDKGRSLLAHAPATVQTQLVSSLRDMGERDRTQLADLFEQWVRGAGIDLAAAPMLGEEEEGTEARHSG